MQRAHLNLMGITGSRCWGVRAQGAEVRAFRFRAWGLGCARDGECVCVYSGQVPRNPQPSRNCNAVALPQKETKQALTSLEAVSLSPTAA